MKILNKEKTKIWTKRYVIPEVLGLIFTLIASYITYKLTNNLILAALIGSLAENIGFYSIIIFREYKNKQYIGNFLIKTKKIFRNLFVEFGISEIIDTFLIRPFYLYLIPTLISNYSLAIIIGKLLADISFYLIAIIFFELANKYFKK